MSTLSISFAGLSIAKETQFRRKTQDSLDTAPEAARNEQAFAKALEAARNSSQASNTGQLSTSAGRRGGIATAVVDAYALNYLGMLLAHPGINVNMQDIESKWTPLHRALYVGNVATCQLLLHHSDIDVQLRDNEGLTPFDLYNLTVEGTWPIAVGAAADFYPLKLPNTSADLFTWGGNRNAALGHGDSKDILFLDMVTLEKTVKPGDPDKFIPIQIKGASMAKLHTTIITDEKGSNLRVYGFGSGGRLGLSHHTQYPPSTSLLFLKSLQSPPHKTTPSPSLPAAKSTHGVLTGGFGFGRDEPIQAIPRKAVGPLKKAVVVGVAACKTASACWTDKELFTWGTNNGQLGYDSAAQAVQVLQRKVTGVQEVLIIALTDTARACLVPTSDNSLINEPTPPGARRPSIIKITACEGTFAALSSYGDVWTFSVQGGPVRTDGDEERMKEREKERERERQVVKPVRVWSARREVDPAKDVALGSDGDLIVCTDSGHVFVRSRSSTSSNTTTTSSHPTLKSTTSSSNLTALTASHLAPSANTKGKFTRVAFIHRVIRVCANAAGAFGAVRLNYVPKVVKVEGNNLGQDLATIRPWARGSEEMGRERERVIPTGLSTYSARGYIKLLEEDKKARKEGKSGVFGVDLQDWGLDGKVKMKLHGADMLVRAGMLIPVHRVVLATRSGVLRGLMDGVGSGVVRTEGVVTLSWQVGSTASSSKSSSRSKSTSANASLPTLTISGIQPLAVLLFLHLLYADEIPVLDTLSFTTVSAVRKDDSSERGGDGGEAYIFEAFASTSTSSFTTTPELAKSTSLKPDAYLELADRRLPAHSVVLRSRCLFYKRFFDFDVWTRERWGDEGVIGVDMRYMEWRVVRVVFDVTDDADVRYVVDETENVGELIDLIPDVRLPAFCR
ncbi:hypothetical protein M422DRAFT_259341 [Sphaerobolus stellatus SS14]|uniref:BTB domain-containing protein n=1 Tax=Sphaerobolus stellatus (strain SS14) TaxID=990650 RepID=A0A0C9VKI5_SPHS4|nr:hypothetical protein M422DRAFT_259341 [Sphaerobolus stellatus SS14]